MLGVNSVDVDDPRAYYNKPCDHARQNHVEIPGSASFPILLLSIWCRGLAIHTLNHHSPVRPSSSSDSPAPVDTCVPLYRRLIPDEAISRIEAIVTNKGDTRLTDCLPGDAAQKFIDTIQEVRLHIPSLPKPRLIVFTLFGSFAFNLSPSTNQALDLPGSPPWLRRKCLTALCHICGRQALLPKSLQIPLCYNRLEAPRYRGGFADVWTGDYQGQRVAAKVLRVYTTSDLDKIRRVS